MNDYDNTEIQVITLIDKNGKFHGTVIPPKGMNVEDAKRVVLDCIENVKTSETWTWGNVHELLAPYGFSRIGQTFAYEHEVPLNWAVMARKNQKEFKSKLYAVVKTEDEADVICNDLLLQGWNKAYKGKTGLMVNYVAPGSLFND